MCIQVMVPHVSVSEFTVVMKVWGDNSETRDTDMIGLTPTKMPIHVYRYRYKCTYSTHTCVHVRVLTSTLYITLCVLQN